MLVYVVRRLLAVIPVMLVVATVSFILIRLAPGDPASVIAGPYASGDDIARLQRSLGLDQALPVQLVKWWGRLARGDLGDSIFLRRPVLEAIFERLEPTLLLTAWSMLVAVAVGLPAGVISARYHNTTVDQSLMAFALVGLSIPNFLLGLLMILSSCPRWRWASSSRPSSRGSRGPACSTCCASSTSSPGAPRACPSAS